MFWNESCANGTGGIVCGYNAARFGPLRQRNEASAIVKGSDREGIDMYVSQYALPWTKSTKRSG
jgi:hypothetical protein